MQMEVNTERTIQGLHLCRSARYHRRISSTVFMYINYMVYGFLEKLIVAQPAKKFLAVYETRKFITMFTKAHHCILFWSNSILHFPTL